MATVVGISSNAVNQQKVEQLWAKTFEYSNRIIHQVRNFGFPGIGKMDAPKMSDMLITLQMISAVIEVLIANSEYDEMRLLLNVKKQITNMELVASAWKAGNQEDFDNAVASLECQAAF